MKRRDSDRLNAAIDRLAGLVPYGALKASTDMAGLLGEVCDMLQARAQEIASAVAEEREECIAVVLEYAAMHDEEVAYWISLAAVRLRDRGGAA